MIGLFEKSFGDGSFRIDDILSIREEVERPGRANTWPAILTDGRSVSLLECDVVRLRLRPVQMLPALPGTNLLHTQPTDDPPFVGRSPVIAWALCLDGNVRPVTPCGVLDGRTSLDREGYHVEMPDGRVEGVGEDIDPVCAESVAHLISIFSRRSEKGGAR